jgi:5-methylcytosine-specific restriction endonuclease McrA
VTATPFGMAEGGGEALPTLRDRVFRRDDFRCVYCGQQFPVDLLTLDHVQPRMRGGDRSAGNLVTACRACNAEKAAMPAWAYLADRPEKRGNFLKYAGGVWARHRRAVLEAAAKRTTGNDREP